MFKEEEDPIEPIQEYPEHVDEGDRGQGCEPVFGRNESCFESSSSGGTFMERELDAMLQQGGELLACEVRSQQGALMETCFLKKEWRMKGLLQQMLQATVS